MNKLLFIIFLVIVIITITSNSNCKECYETKLENEIIFTLKTPSKLNLTYHNKQFYFTNTEPYIFIGTLYNNGLYLLKDGIKNNNFILNYNVSNTVDSKVILKSPNNDNSNLYNISYIFNQTDKNIYLDPINKVILSNDNTGNIVYLTYFIDGSPVNWDYNLNNAMIFEIKYL